MTFKQVKDLLDIGFIPSIIFVPSSNNGNNGSSSAEKANTKYLLLDDSTNSYITQIIGYETWIEEYNEEEMTMYIVKLANGNSLYAANQNDELSDEEPSLSEPAVLEDNGGGAVLR